MKKKIILSILCLLVLFGVSGCGNKEEKTTTQNKNTETEKEVSMQEELRGRKFICDNLTAENLRYISEDFKYMIINNDVYSIMYPRENEIFSNNQHCKFVSHINESIDNVLSENGNNFLIVSNGKTYRLKTINISDFDNDIISIYSYNNDIENYYDKLVLNKDGNVYKYSIGYDNITSDINKIVSKEIVYSKEEYGNIKYIGYEVYRGYDEMLLFSDNGLYINQIVETEECKKYKDIECEKKFVLQEKSVKYKDKIIYLNSEYFIDKDFNIYSTEELYK